MLQIIINSTTSFFAILQGRFAQVYLRNSGLIYYAKVQPNHHKKGLKDGQGSFRDKLMEDLFVLEISMLPKVQLIFVYLNCFIIPTFSPYLIQNYAFLKFSITSLGALVGERGVFRMKFFFQRRFFLVSWIYLHPKQL